MGTGCRCVATGDDWVQLRLCLTCGEVGCCDDSVNKHASVHFAQTRHPIVKSLEPGEDWRYCFVDRALVRPPLGRDPGELREPDSTQR